MNYSKLQYEQILSLANQLKSASSNVESVLNDVVALLNRVGNSDIWTGTAAENAKASFDSLTAKIPEFYVETGKCYTHLISVVENYKSVDNTIANG